MKKPKKKQKFMEGWMRRVVDARIKIAFHGACVVHHGHGTNDMGTSIQPMEQNG